MCVDTTWNTYRIQRRIHHVTGACRAWTIDRSNVSPRRSFFFEEAKTRCETLSFVGKKTICFGSSLTNHAHPLRQRRFSYKDSRKLRRKEKYSPCRERPTDIDHEWLQSSVPRSCRGSFRFFQRPLLANKDEQE